MEISAFADLFERATKKFQLSKRAARTLRAALESVDPKLQPVVGWLSAFLASLVEGIDGPPSERLVAWLAAADWRTVIDAKVPTASLTAGRYLAVAGVAGAYDIEEDSPTAAIPFDWVETRVFNLATILAAAQQE